MAKKVLIADKDVQSLQSVLLKLKEQKYEVTNAYDGIQVIKIAREYVPDLILLSVNLPGGGLNVFDNLKFAMETASIPVILLTDSVDEESKNQFIGRGAKDVIAKPVDAGVLMEKVNQILEVKEGKKKEGKPVSAAPPEYTEEIKTLYEELKPVSRVRPPTVKKKIERTQKLVLVVDDEPDVNSMLSLLVRSQGFQVITALDGQAGLEKARSELPDLILLDVMLPRLDGYRVARMLKFDEKYKHIPIIMLTAKIQEKDKETGMEMGVDVYITKPFDTTEVAGKIKEMLAGEV
jgi:DNA-binding response OmpR family regulator